MCSQGSICDCSFRVMSVIVSNYISGTSDEQAYITIYVSLKRTQCMCVPFYEFFYRTKLMTLEVQNVCGELYISRQYWIYRFAYLLMPYV